MKDEIFFGACPDFDALLTCLSPQLAFPHVQKPAWTAVNAIPQEHP